MLLLACLYFTMLVLQHSNSQLLQLLHLHHCLHKAKSQVLARKIIWTQPDARDKQTEKLICDKSINVWQIVSLWTFDEQKMITACISLKKEQQVLTKTVLFPHLEKLSYFHNWHVQIYVFGYVHRQSSIPILAHNTIHKMWVSLQL
jgi:hypothetical protein